MTSTIISIDLGGTQIRAAQLNSQLEILSRQATETRAQEGLEPTLERIKAMAHAVMPADRLSVAGIGISAPGPLNPATGVVVAPPNLPGWHNVPLAHLLREEFGVPVYVGNDANVAVLAEHLRGAARGNYRHIIYITHSTGIGSGIIVDGRLLLGRDGLAAEVGHIPLVVGGKITSLEEEAAGPDMADRAKLAIQSGRHSIIRDMVHGNLDAIEGRTVGEAAKQGDALALDVVRHAAEMIGLGVVSLLHLFNPEIIVIGGGVAINLGELVFGPMRDIYHRYVRDEAYVANLKVVPAELGDNVSIIGAAALVATRGGVVDVAEVASKIG